MRLDDCPLDDCLAAGERSSIPFIFPGGNSEGNVTFLSSGSSVSTGKMDIEFLS